MYVNMYFTIGANNSFPFVEFTVVGSRTEATERFFPTPSPVTAVPHGVTDRAAASRLLL